ncbi:MAG: hypothetical protein M1493_14305 [Firmicutes bacterium]|nr:hypothetical protein [Bacillota bacterium]
MVAKTLENHCGAYALDPNVLRTDVLAADIIMTAQVLGAIYNFCQPLEW